MIALLGTASRADDGRWRLERKHRYQRAEEEEEKKASGVALPVYCYPVGRWMVAPPRMEDVWWRLGRRHREQRARGRKGGARPIEIWSGTSCVPRGKNEA